MKKKRAFRLFQNCFLVKGAVKYTICDLQRGEIYHIPQGLYTLLEHYDCFCPEDHLNDFAEELHNDILRLCEDLVNKELGFWTDEPENFPELNLEWDTPEFISNAILEIGDNRSNLKDVLNQLQDVFCKHIELRFLVTLPLSEIEDVVQKTDNTIFRNITLLLVFDPSITVSGLKDLMLRYQRIGEIIVHTSPFDDHAEEYNLYFTREKLDSRACCGQVGKEYFAINLQMFAESLNFNSCLNKKVAIDIDGNIKNCPSMDHVFGNIQRDALLEVVKQTEFQKYWGITKDQITVCMDCEYRYVCTDCRAFIKNQADIFSKPLKCSYDPYTGVWN